MILKTRVSHIPVSTKKALMTAAVVLAVGLAAMVLTNYFVDPRHVFHPGYTEQGLANLLLAGKDAVLPTNYDARLLQKDYIAGLQSPRDIIVLGSSRSLQIRSELFPGKRFFNNSLSSAVLSDLVGIYELYRSRGLSPAVVILGLEPWFLNTNSRLAGPDPLDSGYAAAFTRWGLSVPTRLDSSPPVDYSQLWSPTYFSASLTSLSSLGPQTYGTIAAETPDSLIKRADGSLRYDFKTESTSTDEARQKALKFKQSAGLYVQWAAYPAADPLLKQQFEAFLDELHADGVQVILFLPPFHPEAWAAQQADPVMRSLHFTQEYYSDQAKRRNLKLLGSYDPADCLCTASQFFDGLHPREQCIEQIFNGAVVQASLGSGF